jgi:hypothetical protein
MPAIDPQILDQIASEWDPGPFLAAIEKASAQPLAGDPNATGAMDQFGAASSPTGAVPTSGMGFGTIFGDAPMPGKGGAGIGAVPGLAGLMAPPGPQQMAPSAGIRKPPAMGTGTPGYPGMPKLNKIPSLAEILGG